MKKKLFLTGATGKLGSILVKFLEKKYKLIPVGFRNKPKNGYRLDLTKKDRVINFLRRYLSNFLPKILSDGIFIF